MLRQGSNELDSSSATARSSSVMLSAAKHLAATRDRPFAEFTLSGANVLRVTLCDCSNGQGHFVQIEPYLSSHYSCEKLLDDLRELPCTRPQPQVPIVEDVEL